MNSASPVESPARVSVAGIEIERCDLLTAVDLIATAAQRGIKGLVVTPNVDHFVQLDGNSEFRNIYAKALFVFADGMPIVWLSRLLHKAPLPARVTGADLLPAVCQESAKRGLSVYFLGGNPGVAASAAQKLQAEFPSLRISGAYCPPFGFEMDDVETAQIIDDINARGTDILFVGVGAPKQEKWAHANLARLNVGPVLCIGAAFDFVAGTAIRAPRFMRQIGMEWLWRLCSEPRRLWKRYLIRDCRFIVIALREIASKLVRKQ